jgi:hypothetical protein
MTDPTPGTIPATRERKLVSVVPRKGTSNSANSVLEKNFNYQSPDSIALGSGLSATATTIVAGTVARDFYKGYANTTAKNTIGFNQTPAPSPTTGAKALGGIKNVGKGLNPFEHFKKGVNPGSRMKTLGRAGVFLSAGVFLGAMYQEVAGGQELDRKIQIAQDSGKLNSTLLINNSGYFSGDYKAINLQFRINSDGKVEMGRTEQASEAETEADARNAAIIGSENEYTTEGAIEALNELVTLARVDNDKDALNFLKEFVGKITGSYKDADKKILDGMRDKLNSKASESPQATTQAETSTSADPVQAIIDKQTNLFIQDALAQAQKKGILTPEKLERNSKNKLNYLKDTARIVNHNLTQAQLNSIRID